MAFTGVLGTVGARPGNICFGMVGITTVSLAATAISASAAAAVLAVGGIAQVLVCIEEGQHLPTASPLGTGFRGCTRCNLVYMG